MRVHYQLSKIWGCHYEITRGVFGHCCAAHNGASRGYSTEAARRRPGAGQPSWHGLWVVEINAAVTHTASLAGGSVIGCPGGTQKPLAPALTPSRTRDGAFHGCHRRADAAIRSRAAESRKFDTERCSRAAAAAIISRSLAGMRTFLTAATRVVFEAMRFLHRLTNVRCVAQRAVGFDDWWGCSRGEGAGAT